MNEHETDELEGVEQHAFLIMAKKYRHHVCQEPDCMVCEAIEIIEGGRFEVGTQPLPEEGF